ncbi:DUF155-domain-containing protein [Cantharellus anzutake]|uniref:DUF155-domain-containing protein n=1 Tax=Cantharellus anzutake TaxID=1750568 RepID=UPI00190563B9|nr:DUF155-domain-containing protein [Cantharellus anzutake]KAF8336575.1 DUF155-domain-containing protein [Cantharellus anzutake]
MSTSAALPTTQKSAVRVTPEASPKARGPNRSTKAAHKLKVLPEQPEIRTQSQIIAEDGDEEEDGTPGSPSDPHEEEDDEEAEPYKQIAQIPAGTARKDALRLTKREKARLPRVTAYCTANSYRLSDIQKFLNARKTSHRTDPKLFDEAIYSPYSFAGPRSEADHHPAPISGDLLGIPELVRNDVTVRERRSTKTVKRRPKFDKVGQEGIDAEVFLFEYGTVVCWGMTEAQEKRFLSSIRRFEQERLAPDDVEKEDLNYYYANYSRIYNDVITLRKGSSFMTKLSLSHALAQSVKISLFEQLISNTIEETKDIPEVMSKTGKIHLHHDEIMQQIGQLFILRMDINLVGSVLDSPELFWTYPDLQPLYEAARSYLEIPQRVDLLNTRVGVLHDMLKLLKESVQSKHAERLEQIVIALIAVEIVLGLITILVDLFAV